MRMLPRSELEPELLRIGAVAEVLEEQKPVFVPDLSQEMLKHPEHGSICTRSCRAKHLFISSVYLPETIRTPVNTKVAGEEFAPEDVEMLRSLASHVAVALECALARDNAELYQRQVVKERDRLRLLLEINNHVVSKLDIDELFRRGLRNDPLIFRE